MTINNTYQVQSILGNTSTASSNPVILSEYVQRFTCKESVEVDHDQELANMDQLIDPQIFDKWIDQQDKNSPMWKTLFNIRKNIIGHRDIWSSREFYASRMCGYSHIEDMHGPDAINIHGKPVEIKVNWTSANPNEGDKLNGKGTFNDCTREKLQLMLDEDFVLTVPCFVENTLIVALEIPIKWRGLQNRLNRYMDNHEKPPSEEEKESKGGKNRCTPRFTYMDYKDCPDIKLAYVVDRETLKNHKKYLTANFYTLVCQNM